MTPSQLVVFLLVVTQADALGSLSQIQQPMPGIIVPNIWGRWFTTYRQPPCSWSGSIDFADINALYNYDGKNTVSFRLTWGNRPGVCTTMLADMKLTPTPGVFLVKDSIGDNASGRMVVIGTDYKGFLIYWGCTKFSVFGDKCDDPFLVVETRLPKPSLHIISKINSVLMQRFGITVNALRRVVHTGACYGVKKIA